MDHVAIMRPSWGLTGKILSGEKTVESRWLMNRSAPWGRVRAGDRVYFKDSGRPVTIEAEAERVEQLSGLTPARVKAVLEEHGEADGIGEEDMPRFLSMFRGKRYCVLVFLRGARRVGPFEVDKSGFGSMSAWLTVEDVEMIRKRP